MSTDTNNMPDWDDMISLFRPGSGVMPPKLAGREPALKQLNKLLNNLVKYNRPPASDVVLYGPRGNGKTVLLDAFKQQCTDTDVISLAPTQIKNESDLAALLLYEDERFQKNLDAYRPDSGRIDLKIAAVEWRRMSQTDKDDHARKHLVSLLVARCYKKPLVVMLDEAHTLDLDVGRILLNASQLIRREGAPFLLALAGTPNLWNRLGQMNSTFWSRSEIIDVGRLDAAATREALATPLKAHGISLDEDALVTVVAETQHYPYFIQLWGEALCLTLRDREATLIDMEIVKTAHPVFAERQIKYYKDRYRELKNQAQLEVAKAVAGVFERKHSIDEDTLEDYLSANTSLDLQGARTALETLSDLGYIWQQGTSTCFEPGIPSLMTYVLSERQRYSDRQLYALSSSPLPDDSALPKP